MIPILVVQNLQRSGIDYNFVFDACAWNYGSGDDKRTRG